jgi:hypothetical protein
MLLTPINLFVLETDPSRKEFHNILETCHSLLIIGAIRMS